MQQRDLPDVVELAHKNEQKIAVGCRSRKTAHSTSPSESVPQTHTDIRIRSGCPVPIIHNENKHEYEIAPLTLHSRKGIKGFPYIAEKTLFRSTPAIIGKIDIYRNGPESTEANGGAASQQVFIRFRGAGEPKGALPRMVDKYVGQELAGSHRVAAVSDTHPRVIQAEDAGLGVPLDPKEGVPCPFHGGDKGAATPVDIGGEHGEGFPKGRVTGIAVDTDSVVMVIVGQGFLLKGAEERERELREHSAALSDRGEGGWQRDSVTEI